MLSGADISLARRGGWGQAMRGNVKGSASCFSDRASSDFLQTEVTESIAEWGEGSPNEHIKAHT